MATRREVLATAAVGLAVMARAQTAEGKLPLFAVEFRTGPKWDPGKPAQEQLHFKEHSANLKRLRDEGRLKLGARYSDKGLVVLAGASAEDVRREIEQDPTVQSQVFAYDLHPFSVFYSGCV